MINYFTPDDSQDFLKQNKNTINLSQEKQHPSTMTLNFIFGYSAALSVFKSTRLGYIKILLN